MKVIYLDVDGVLNRWGTKERIERADGLRGMRGVEQVFCERLRRIVKETGAAIVLSSTWRKLPETLWYLWRELGEDMKARSKGHTPVVGNRSDDIQAHLKRHPEITRYVALDDDFDVVHLGSGNYVLTEERVGLTEEHAQKAIELLNRRTA